MYISLNLNQDFTNFLLPTLNKLLKSVSLSFSLTKSRGYYLPFIEGVTRTNEMVHVRSLPIAVH